MVVILPDIVDTPRPLPSQDNFAYALHVPGQSDYFRPCIAMNAAHVSAEAAIITRSGFTVDLADFAIASQLSMVPGEAMTELVN
jgi:hypothetical protein